MDKNQTLVQHQPRLRTNTCTGSTKRVWSVGYVVRLDAYALPAFGGCCALLALHNSPTNDIVAVLTRDPRIQSVFETALATNKLIAVFGTQLYQQTNPQGERWADVVYNTYRVVLHNVA